MAAVDARLSDLLGALLPALLFQQRSPLHVQGPRVRGRRLCLPREDAEHRRDARHLHTGAAQGLAC